MNLEGLAVALAGMGFYVEFFPPKRRLEAIDEWEEAGGVLLQDGSGYLLWDGDEPRRFRRCIKGRLGADAVEVTNPDWYGCLKLPKSPITEDEHQWRLHQDGWRYEYERTLYKDGEGPD